MLARLLLNSRVFATPVVLALVAKYGIDVVEYEPETIRECLKSEYSQTPEAVVSRVIAALGLFTSNRYWQDPAIFSIVSRSLNRATRPFAGPATVEDMVWGVTEANFLRFDGESEAPEDKFNAAVSLYVSQSLKSEGLTKAPAELSFAQLSSGDSVFYDPEMTVSLQSREDAELQALSDFANNQMLEMLDQINSAKIPMDEGAQQQLINLQTELYKDISTR